MKELDESKFPGMSSLSHESHEAGKVKKQVPILVILGNPPYSGHSSSTGEWISETIKEYYKVDGKPLGEKNPKWLQDDYVKFIRFSQWKINQAGEGVLGFITNHSYLCHNIWGNNLFDCRNSLYRTMKILWQPFLSIRTTDKKRAISWFHSLSISETKTQFACICQLHF
jgi:predicted helicase